MESSLTRSFASASAGKPPRGLLPTAFYRRHTLEVAHDLLGKVLVVRSSRGQVTAGRIVETEAYRGEDPASHSCRGETPRCAVMFGDAGRAYVYFIYGMYEMLNFVTEPKGHPGAVLIRALEPVGGEELMRKRRLGVRARRDLANGPGKLCRAMGIRMSHNEQKLAGPSLFVLDDGYRPESISSSGRVGINAAREVHWRFFITDNDFVSRVKENAASIVVRDIWKKFPPELLQKIKESVNILEVVGEHVVLRKSGSNYTGLCPFHSERSPSFSVHEQKGMYYCYGCQRGGDIVRFVQEMHGISFPEAVEELADRGKVKMPAGMGQDEGASADPAEQERRAKAREKVATAQKLNRFAVKFFQDQLGREPEAKKYLKARGVNDELARSFYVGAAPAGWEGLATFLKGAQAPLPVAAELGLIQPSTKNAPGSSGYFDLFRGRVIFPIIDLRGKVVGFGGRVLAKEETPKYLNSKESLLFHKSKVAFGFFQAQKHIREKNEVILVEGYFDVLALHAAGFQNVVATCGTSLTPDHLQLFKRFAERVTILFDGDKAGVAATERAMLVGLEHGQVLYGAAMPEGLDPDEVLFDQETGEPNPGGREKMEAILKAAHPILDARIEDAIKYAAKGPEERTQALKRAGGWLAKFQDPVGREVRMDALASRLGVTRALIQQAMGGAQPAAPARVPSAASVAPRPGVVKTGGAPRTKAARLTTGERALLGALARGGDFLLDFAKVGGELPPGATIADVFEYPPAHSFMEAWVAQGGPLEQRKSLTVEELDPELDGQVRSTIMEALVASEVPFEHSDFRSALERARGRCWARFSQRIKERIAAAEAKQDAELHAQLLKEYLDVQRKMKEFTNFYDEAQGSHFPSEN